MTKIKRGTMVNKKALSLAICLAVAIPTATNALSLGNIESKSSLNQPFRGKISLLQTNSADVKNLRIKVAPIEVFNRVGIDRPAFLNNIRFRTSMENGQAVILVTSDQAINEPFLNFLLEVSWPNGQLLKEYTVLLDPPVLLRPDTAIASNNAGVRAEPTAQGVITRTPQVAPQLLPDQGLTQLQRQAQQVLQNQPAQDVVTAPVSSSSKSYRVRKGDNLSNIASRLGYSGVLSEQMMVALFEKNRLAFSNGNMNNLKAGAIITRPSLEEVRNLTVQAAKSQVAAQAKAWKARRAAVQLASNKSSKPTSTANSARVEILGKTDSSTASSSNGNAVAGLNQELALLNESLTTKQQENADLTSRISELESILRKKNRLISLKNDQLADIQSSISGGQAEQVTQEGLAPETIGRGIQSELVTNTGAENGEIVRATTETAVVDGIPVPEVKVEPTIIEPIIVEPGAVEPAVQQKPEPESASAFKPAPESGIDIMALVTSPMSWGLGAALLGLLGLFALMRRRKNKGEDFSDLIDSGLYDQKFIDDDILTTDVDQQGAVFGTAEVMTNEDINRPQETATNEDNDNDRLEDLIQESDVYIVYGLHDQAESVIKRALVSHPNSTALHAKLLENYKAAGDAESFEATTKLFIGLDTNDKQNHWDEICEWGKALLPESKLYNSPATLATPAAAGTKMVVDTMVDDSEALDVDDFATDILLDEFKNIDDINGMDSDDFSINSDDDFSSNIDSIELDIDDEIEGMDFLFDDESLEDLLNVDDKTSNDFPSTVVTNDLDDLKIQLGGKTDENLLADFDDNLSFLDLDDDAEVIYETQIETKIDLARAYIDMGDIEGARSTLEEVMDTGNDEQKRQAEELLHQNG